ncbi:DNA/RNA nuclease SfsA [Faecalicatena sp. BF-R-105]|nr:DNA/RNA nuclease SfsA [Faecalicatena sp. BF-R-105]
MLCPIIMPFGTPYFSYRKERSTYTYEKQIFKDELCTPCGKTSAQLHLAKFKYGKLYYRKQSKKRRFSFLGYRNVIFREYIVDGYKCDYYIKDTNTIIEVKSVITTKSVAEFPSVFSQRALLQFEKLRQHLLKGVQVCYMIVSLNPNTKSIRLCEESAEYEPFIECTKLGMMVVGISCGMINGKPNISKLIPVFDSNGAALK